MLLVHGTGEDASQWMEVDENGESIGMRYAQEGYDVWYANMRGSVPSSPRRKLADDSDDKACADNYWEFDYNDLAEKDLPAMIEKVVEVSGKCQKVTLVGHSLGGTILANGLSKSEFARKYVAQAVGIAPCFVASPGSLGDLNALLSMVSYEALNAFIELFSVKSLFGRDWDSLKEAVCLLS